MTVSWRIVSAGNKTEETSAAMFLVVRVWLPCSEHTSPGEALNLFQKNEHPTSRAAIHYKPWNQSQTPVMWPWPAKMAIPSHSWFYNNFTCISHSTFLRYDNLHNQATHSHVWELASTTSASHLAAFTGNYNINTSYVNTISFVLAHWTPISAYQFHVWVLSPACPIRLKLLPLPLQLLHIITRPAFSMLHHTA